MENHVSIFAPMLSLMEKYVYVIYTFACNDEKCDFWTSQNVFCWSIYNFVKDMLLLCEGDKMFNKVKPELYNIELKIRFFFNEQTHIHADISIHTFVNNCRQKKKY